MKRSERAERAGDILETFFRRHKISGGSDHLAFHRSWEEIVGFDIASHTSVSDIRNRALLVEVDHPAWMQMVQLRQNQIILAVQKRFPRLGVRSLTLRLVERLASPISAAASPPRDPGGSAPRDSGAAAQPTTVRTEPTPGGSDGGDGSRLRSALARLGRAIGERAGEGGE